MRTFSGGGIVRPMPDLVYALLVFQHVPRAAAAECLATFAAALRLGGRCVVEFLDREAAPDAGAEAVRTGGPGPLTSYAPEEAEALFVEAGFRVDRLDRVRPYFVLTASKPTP